LDRVAGTPPLWADVLLLKTCNRIEIYAVTPSPRRAVRAIARALDLANPSPFLYVLEDEDAAQHLLRVTSGFDSVAQGESQIATQVRHAASERAGATGGETILSSLLVRALRVAARIRHSAGLSGQGRSASEAAIRFIEQAIPVVRPQVILLGTGKMARIAAEGLDGRAVLTVLNRTPRAIGTPQTRSRDADGFASLPQALVAADVVIAATASPERLVTRRSLGAAMAKRSGRRLWLIDLGFPRNVDPSCRSLEGVTLVDIDGLAPWGSQRLAPGTLARAESRIRADSIRLLRSLRPKDDVQVDRFRKVAEALRHDEVARAFARLPHLSEAERTVVDQLATRLLNRFLHEPTERLRILPEEGRARLLDELLQDMERAGGASG
jgi:glutamyl-tRNA reductase